MGLGSDHGGFSPFDIYFRYMQDDETIAGVEPFETKPVACYEAYSVRATSFFIQYNKRFDNGSICLEHERHLLLRGLRRKLPRTETVAANSRAGHDRLDVRAVVRHAHRVRCDVERFPHHAVHRLARRSER